MSTPRSTDSVHRASPTDERESELRNCVCRPDLGSFGTVKNYLGHVDLEQVRAPGVLPKNVPKTRGE